MRNLRVTVLTAVFLLSGLSCQRDSQDQHRGDPLVLNHTSRTTVAVKIPKQNDIERAAFWKARGFKFDPKQMSAKEMNEKVKELDPVVYWKAEGFVYDPKANILIKIPKRDYNPLDAEVIELGIRLEGEQPDSNSANVEQTVASLKVDLGQISAKEWDEEVKMKAATRLEVFGKALAGVDSLWLTVSLSEGSIEKPGLWTSEGITQAQVKREIELALVSAGLKVAPAGPSVSGLVLSAYSVDQFNGNYLITVEIQLLDQVYIVNRGITTSAVTWRDEEFVSYNGRLDSSDRRHFVDNPRQLIRRCVNGFINDWIAANENGVPEEPEKMRVVMNKL